jgi:Fic family protein
LIRSNASAEKIRKKVLAEYVYHTNKLEGSSLDWNETLQVLETRKPIAGKTDDSFIAIRHIEAVKFLGQLAKRELFEEDILCLHHILFSKVLSDAGNYRKVEVAISGAEFTPPQSFEVQSQIQKLLNEFKKRKAANPVDAAALFHLRFVQIHPFTDGNGRVARLLMNLVLRKNSFPILTVIPVEKRERYLDVLSLADRGKRAPLVNFVGHCIEETISNHTPKQVNS